MAEKVFLKPQSGMKIRMPETNGHLPDEGMELELTHYWRRRIKDGDVVKVQPPKDKKAAAADA